ncbi:Glycosyltransferase, family GT31 [Zostera marina]|uniref:Hexosyltransferase n=1 Tax=Zostera marina TaxID=29655 RepID=A0A0K9PU65_ZOSMR|nr:Glycosyltransferase, family GT31 [Zostera marina]
MEKSKIGGRGKAFIPAKVIIAALCLSSFTLGIFFSDRMWSLPSSEIHNPSPPPPPPPLPKDHHRRNTRQYSKLVNVQTVGIPQDCRHVKRKLGEDDPVRLMEEVGRTHKVIQSLDRSISSLEMELAMARSKMAGDRLGAAGREPLKKAFVVIGINTAFSSKKRRESVRGTWVPRGSELERLEKEKGIVIRFVIGHSATPGSFLDRTIDDEDAETKDFLRLDHVEGYHELSSKTRIYFSTAIAKWDANFYVKVDDDVHVNLGELIRKLAAHRNKPRVYIGCMKSGPVLSQKGFKYHEPEYWKFGDEGNKYFRHATGQIYAISKDLADYVTINSPILHRYANEDVSLGAWMIGLDVEYVDDRTMCCGTPPDCEWKRQTGNVCVASFDWSCSGVCKSVERMEVVHSLCGENEGALWNITLN